MHIQTLNLTGNQLEWAAAKALGYDVSNAYTCSDRHGLFNVIKGHCIRLTQDWNQVGPVIVAKRIGLLEPTLPTIDTWQARLSGKWADDINPLAAAMKVLVLHKLGESVDIPDTIQ